MYTTSARSMPTCGRPGAVSSIFTAMTGSLGRLPMPVSGLTDAWWCGFGLGFGLDFGLGAGAALDEVVAGGGAAEVLGGADEPLLVQALASRASAVAEITPRRTARFVGSVIAFLTSLSGVSRAEVKPMVPIVVTVPVLSMVSVALPAVRCRRCRRTGADLPARPAAASEACVVPAGYGC